MMEFSDIRILWDEQKKEHQFTMDSEILYRRLERSHIKTRKLQSFQEWMFSFMTAALGLIIISEPLLEQKEYHQYPIGGLFLMLSAFFLYQKVQRIKERPNYDHSFLTIIDNSIIQLNTYSHWTKRAHALFWICMSTSMVVTFILFHDSKPIWLWFSFLLMMLVSFLGLRNQLKNKTKGISKLAEIRKQFET